MRKIEGVSKMLVTIESCANGYIIKDPKTGYVYVADKIQSYSYSMNTVVNILEHLVAAEKPDTDTPEEN